MHKASRVTSYNLIYNYFAFFTAAVQALIVNLLLLKYADISVLAYFNYCYLLVIVGGQIACFGTHYSVLHLTSNKKQDNFINISSALTIVSILSIFIAIVLAIFIYSLNPAPLLPDLNNGFILCAIAIPLLAFNKILLAYMNGMNRMFIFSTIHFIRAMIALIGVGYWFWGKLSISPFLFFVLAEAIVFFILMGLFLKNEQAIFNKNKFKQTVKTHFYFGKYTAFGAFAMESNIRIDCFFISFMMSPAVFAKYSLLSMAFEGLHYFYSVIRNFVNVNVVSQSPHAESELGFYKKLSLLGGMLIFTLCGILYIPIVEYLNLGLESYYATFMILICGLLIASYFLPFDQLANQKGNPRYYLFMALTTMSTNIILNLILIPIWGVMGAATATAIAYSILSFMIFKSMKLYKVM